MYVTVPILWDVAKSMQLLSKEPVGALAKGFTTLAQL